MRSGRNFQDRCSPTAASIASRARSSLPQLICRGTRRGTAPNSGASGRLRMGSCSSRPHRHGSRSTGQDVGRSVGVGAGQIELRTRRTMLAPAVSRTVGLLAHGQKIPRRSIPSGYRVTCTVPAVQSGCRLLTLCGHSGAHPVPEKLDVRPTARRAAHDRPLRQARHHSGYPALRRPSLKCSASSGRLQVLAKSA